LLKVLARTRAPLGLKELAAQAGLTPSAAHRYLASYRRLGLVRQDPKTRAYDMGPFALELGVSAIGRSTHLNAVQELQQKVRDRLDESVLVAVWGTYGPVIISIAESSKPIIMTMRIGATLPLLRSATGWIFAAFMPRTMIKPLIRAEIAAKRGPVEQLDRRGLEEKIEAIRSSRVVFHSGHMLPGVSAIATPMVDSHGALVAAMTVFGGSQLLDASQDAPAADVLRETAAGFTQSTRRSRTG
jgi:DNA-binding IclR family transcriptional regulator